jgi:16S rRNA (uracil1498-N3)-methyltransferase
MALRRFFVEEIEAKDGSCTITGTEAKHITRVLRMGRGDRFILMDGKGARFQALIESAGRQGVLVVLERPLPKRPRSPVEITLCQALLRSRAMDYVIEKTSELGVDRIFPFSSQRTVIRLGETQFSKKREHWRKIARSTTKQCDRDVPAEIGPLFAFEDLVSKWKEEDALKVILWEDESERDLKDLLKEPFPMKKLIGLLGPEGGFSREEIQRASKAGFTSVSLGYRVLRAETAAIAMVALVQYEWGDLSLSNI